ncbi:NADH-ubiquinone oxidoreductase chain [Trichinella spiralis]|uniref:NADH:ubiquinone reductase (H(+)-translocating) n=1 Tax=Trichinella spiralis TaxID=6334 RepID=A0ABR3KR69_TRISP
MTTIMMNRVGDFALMVMVVTLGCSFVFDYEYVVYSSLRLVMFLGAMIAKRAQVPMRRWLPIAMAAPTPVSSLVHSSTLVVAGCVLCVKLGNCMRVVWVNGLLIVVGLLTRLYASLMAFFEFDLKKILAYSTMSQVAMVMLMLLSGIYSLMVIHIVNHALVKALLFMNVGIIMRYMFANQEVRMVTCVRYNVGFVLGRVILCLVVMCGLTFTSCYYSKEYSVCLSIKEDTLFHLVNVVLFMSVMYSLRMIYVLMGGLSGKVWVFSGVMNVDLYYGCLNSRVVGLKVFMLSFTMNNWLSMWTMLELTTWVIMVIIVEELSSSEGVSWVNMWFLTVVHKVVPFVVSMLVVDSVLIGVVCVVSILWSVFRWLWLASSDLRSRVRGIVIL